MKKDGTFITHKFASPQKYSWSLSKLDEQKYFQGSKHKRCNYYIECIIEQQSNSLNFVLGAHKLGIGDLPLLREEFTEAVLVDVLGQILDAKPRPADDLKENYSEQGGRQRTRERREEQATHIVDSGRVFPEATRSADERGVAVGFS